jgi:hypothetical protein
VPIDIVENEKSSTSIATYAPVKLGLIMHR